MWDKQLRIEHAAVQVDPTWGDAAASAFLRVESGKPQAEIVIERSDLPVGNPNFAGDS